jgi:hypothetical protein
MGLSLPSESESAPDPTVWQFRHGGGEVLALPEGDFRGKVFCAAFGIGFRHEELSRSWRAKSG